MKKTQKKLQKIELILNEKQRRMVYAAEAEQLGRGGKSKISAHTGMSRSTLNAGFRDSATLSQGEASGDNKRIRRVGGGRKKITETAPKLLSTLESLVEPLTRGDTESPLRWTIKSTRTLSKELEGKGFKVGKSTIALLLGKLGYSLQANQKCPEGTNHPDGNAQIEYINDKVQYFMDKGLPVISIDTKRKKNDGNHKNVGTNCDTSALAINNIKYWWKNEGKIRYPDAQKLLVTADSIGSNRYDRNLWKYELQQFANEYKIEISVCHFPPGTIKWNKEKHHLFSFVSMNCRKKSSIDYHETTVNLIAATGTEKEPTVICRPDGEMHEEEIKISDKQTNKIKIENDNFHGEWNYSILEQNE